MRPEMISEALKTDLNVYSVFSLLSAALESAFLVMDVTSLLPASSALPVKYLQTHRLHFLPCNASFISSVFLPSFQLRVIEHDLVV